MVNPKRLNALTDHAYATGKIVYWMSRDQRVHDNWALLAAQELAREHGSTVAVVFCLRRKFDFATRRMVTFMLEGLAEVEKTLAEKNIPFYFLLGEPEIEIAQFVKEHQVGAVVSDFSPLKNNRAGKSAIAQKVSIPFYEVDTHNIVPIWVASNKQEFGAYTIRPKIHSHLPEFLTEFPPVAKQAEQQTEPIDWNNIDSHIEIDETVPEVDWITPGEKAADAALKEFLEQRLKNYDQDRNDPTKDAQSHLSPYIHFGQISSQRIALEVEKVEGYTNSKNAFLEELIVRKELSDNFCFYNPNYDNPDGFPNWAKATLDKHTNDRREYLYTLQELESARTHDELWNAAQKEMIQKGNLHGYLRMYWAKKILEWTKHSKQAMDFASYLNDRYFLDGRDPNGYTGIAWSVGGVHDRAWFERAIFGKVRYMNYNGARSKFKVAEYIEKVEQTLKS